MLEKRRIEAEMLGHVYAVLKDRIGVEAAQKAIGEAVRRSSIEQAQRFAQAEPDGTSPRASPRRRSSGRRTTRCAST